MIDQLISNYLERLPTERDFYPLFATLLGAMNYKSVFLTHGVGELGKDFIALSPAKDEQWVFQCKKGNVTVPSLNSGQQQQLLTAGTTGIQHPAFDKNLPRKVVLVTNGKISNPAAAQIRELSQDVLEPLGRLPLEIWDRAKLVELILEHGISAIYEEAASDKDVARAGRFFVLYGSSETGGLRLQATEEHSRHWLATNDTTDGYMTQLLVAATEASLLINQSMKVGRIYDALFVQVCLLRALLFAWTTAQSELVREPIRTLIERQSLEVLNSAETFVYEAINSWEATDESLVHALRSNALFVSYPVNCCRIVEVLSLLALAGGPNKETYVQTLVEFVASEPGCSRPISERYTISVVLTGLALFSAGHVDLARQFVRQAGTWLCDVHEDRGGLAHVDADPQSEVDIYLGSQFHGVNTEVSTGSLLATALVDLARYIQDAELYSDLVNDFSVLGIKAEYFLIATDEQALLLDHPDIGQYIALPFPSELPDDSRSSVLAHEELREFSVATAFGNATLLSLSIVLRDRYFPSLWSQSAPA